MMTIGRNRPHFQTVRPWCESAAHGASDTSIIHYEELRIAPEIGQNRGCYPVVIEHGNRKSILNEGFNEKIINKRAIFNVYVRLPERHHADTGMKTGSKWKLSYCQVSGGFHPTQPKNNWKLKLNSVVDNIWVHILVSVDYFTHDTHVYLYIYI